MDERLIDKSSLGTRAARSYRRSTDDAQVASVLRRIRAAEAAGDTDDPAAQRASVTPPPKGKRTTKETADPTAPRAGHTGHGLADDPPALDERDPAVTSGQVRTALHQQMRPWLTEQDGQAAVLGKVLDDVPDGHGVDTAWLAGRQRSTAELLDLVKQQTTVISDEGPLRLTPDHRSAGLLAAAWRTVVHRQSRAVLGMVTAGFAHEALANARVAIEHAALLCVLTQMQHDDALDAFVAAVDHAGQDQAARHLKVLSALDQQSGGGHHTLLAAAHLVADKPDRTKRSRRIWDGEPASLFSAMPSGMTAYSFYKSCSNTIHAGAGSAMPYLASAVTHGRVSRVPLEVHTAEMLAVLSWCLLQADTTLDGFIPTPILATKQQRLITSGDSEQ